MTLVVLKDPDAVLDYQHNWDDGYLAAGEDISTSSWTVNPNVVGELAIDSDTNTTKTATVFLSGGNRRGVYKVTNKITTNGSRTDERTIVVRVEDR